MPMRQEGKGEKAKILSLLFLKNVKNLFCIDLSNTFKQNLDKISRPNFFTFSFLNAHE